MKIKSIFIIGFLIFILALSVLFNNNTFEGYENKKYNVAICYWGLTSSTKLVYDSHEKKLFDILKNNNIDYDVYLHTWKVDKQIRWSDESSSVVEVNTSIDYDEYKLLNPYKYKIDNQDEFLDSITFSDYFDKELYDKYGDSEHEWKPELIRNHLCALESQKRVTQMCIDENKNYDFVIYVRPDVELHDNIPVDIFDNLKNEEIAIPNNGHWDGYNDKFAITPFNDCAKYGKRIDEIVEYRKTQGRIVSEVYTKYTINKYFNNVHYVDFNFSVIKPK